MITDDLVKIIEDNYANLRLEDISKGFRKRLGKGIEDGEITAESFKYLFPHLQKKCAKFKFFMFIPTFPDDFAKTIERMRELKSVGLPCEDMFVAIFVWEIE